MALEATFRDLLVGLQKLHDALNALQVTIGDRPPDDGAALADGLENSVLDVMGTLHEARKGAFNARGAVSDQIDLDRARRALTVCQDRFHRVSQMFSADFLSYENLRELQRLGVARGREWLLWASSTKKGVNDCRHPLEEASLSLGRCWEEIAEHAGATSVSVRTTNVGQKIISKPSATD